MLESLENIIEVAVEQKLCHHEKHLRHLLSNCFSIVSDSVEEKGIEMADVHFNESKFFKDLSKTLNGIKRSDLYRCGAELFCLIFNTLNVEVTKEECFIFFHLRDLGKFRTKEDKVFNELKGEWGIHKDFKLEKEDFEEAVRELKNHGFIGHRRGTITLSESTVFRYKLA